MPGKLRHLAIISDRPPLLSRFYREVFGMKGSPPERLDAAASLSDGYVGMNVNYRAPGRRGGLEHFGFEVEDVDEVRQRLDRGYPGIEFLQRPSNRPFAGISTHDPVGNVFDLSQREMTNRAGVYTDDIDAHPRRVDHVVLRVAEAERMARFYLDVFGLAEVERGPTDPNFYLTDGEVTFIIAPWRISDYEGMGIEPPALEHIGFRVDSIDAVLADLEAMSEREPELAPKPWKAGTEGEVRLRRFAECRRGRAQITDPDGVLIDLTEG